MINPLTLIARVSTLPSPRHWRSTRLAAVVMLLGSLAIGSQAWADGNLRSSFPGRRVGGGTRGECTARFVANLVPNSHVFAPGPGGFIAILQGPSANLHPLIVAFTAANTNGVVEPGASVLETRQIPPSSVGLLLLKAPSSSGNIQWETKYRCDGGSVDSDPLSFVSAGAPPAVSLLVKTAEPVDRLFQAELIKLKSHCGGTIDKEQIAKSFSFDELLGNDWPSQLPVRCL